MGELTGTVVIASKNRKDDLRRAIASCLAQTAGPEVIVIDDGSTDGSATMVQAEFPTVRLYRDEVSRGVSAQRNRGVRLASHEIVFTIDDDAVFASPHTVAQTLAEFTHPEVAAVAIPLINVNTGPAVLQRAPRPGQIFVTDHFWATAYAVRRAAFLHAGGYREFLRQQFEEEELAIRMLDLGYFTCLGNADPLQHFESPMRDRRWRDQQGMRNKILFAWYDVPMPDFLFFLFGTVAKMSLHAWRHGYWSQALYCISLGFAACVRERGERRPVRRETYRLFRRLRKSAGLPLEAIALGLSPAPRHDGERVAAQ
jgi:glycosyltransferase involved in cell wall biosynthesis